VNSSVSRLSTEERGAEPAFAQLPLASLSIEDLQLVTEFVLRSGSLKDLARHYGVSYPTIRTRLDGVIERLRAAVENKPRDPLADALAELVQRGELTARGARRLLAAAQERERSTKGGGR